MATATSTDLESTAVRTGIAFALVVGAVFFGAVLAFAVGFGGALAGIDRPVLAVLGMLAAETGYLVVGTAFVALVVGRSFVPVGRPTTGELRVATLAVAVPAAAETVRRLLVRFASLSRGGTVSTPDGGGVAVALAVIAITVVVAPPVEELFFRGVVQRYVREASSVPVAVAVATVLFVPVHALGIVANAGSVAGGLAVVAVLAALSVAVGWAYARTDNLAVPVAVHATYNAFAVLVGIAGV